MLGVPDGGSASASNDGNGLHDSRCDGDNTAAGTTESWHAVL